MCCDASSTLYHSINPCLEGWSCCCNQVPDREFYLWQAVSTLMLPLQLVVSSTIVCVRGPCKFETLFHINGLSAAVGGADPGIDFRADFLPRFCAVVMICLPLPTVLAARMHSMWQPRKRLVLLRAVAEVENLSNTSGNKPDMYRMTDGAQPLDFV